MERPVCVRGLWVGLGCAGLCWAEPHGRIKQHGADGQASTPKTLRLPLLSPQTPSAVAPMASPAAAAAASRAHRLSRIFSSSSPTAQSPKPLPTPTPPAGDAGHKPRKHLRAILKGIIRERDPDKLVSGFIAASSASSRFRDRHRVYEVAVSRLASIGRRDGVAAILDAQKPFLEASTEGFAARLIRLYGRASMPSHAAATFRDLPPQHKSTMAFNSLLSAYAEVGEFEALATAFQEIPASHPSIVPSVYSYNILIHALCQKPDLSAALDAIALMEKCGVSPDNISFNTLLNGFYNNGRMDDAETVWEMMKDRNLAPDTKSYNAKLRGLIAEGRIEDAVAVVERMEKDGPKPDTVTYNELIRGYCKDGRLEEAKKLYDDLVKNECAPNKGTYETLVPHLVQTGELDCALRCCHEIFSRSCRVNCSVLQEVVTALVAESRVEEATRIVELGRKNYYPRKGLMMPYTGKDNEVQAETNGEESISEEEREEEEDSAK